MLGSLLIKNGDFDLDHIAKRFKKHRDGRQDNALHLWLLFNMTAWYDHWIGGASSP
jgi:hypothetical protein